MRSPIIFQKSTQLPTIKLNQFYFHQTVVAYLVLDGAAPLLVAAEHSLDHSCVGMTWAGRSRLMRQDEYKKNNSTFVIQNET
jgi:hypothetical protein